MIEKKEGWQFILTGSSARKLKRSGVNLLGGRAVLRFMHPFMAAELGERFDSGRSLRQGMLPVVWGAKAPQDILKTYAALYMKEEVQLEGLVRNIGSFARFLEAVSFSHASILNTSEIARECQVGRKTVDSYLEILEDLLLGFRLPVFTRRAKRIVVQHPKFYYFDAGVFRSIRPAGPLDRPEEIDGAAIEGLVAQHLRAFCAYDSRGYEMFYWRTKSGVEVDFVLYGKAGITAIEVKRSAKVNSKDLAGLRAFGEDYPQAGLFFLYGGKERLKINGVQCVPCEAFLRELSPGVAF
jgi:predicted AAA+ superfamily ATPase